MKGLKAIQTEEDVTAKIVVLGDEDAMLYYGVSGNTQTLINMVAVGMLKDPVFEEIIKNAIDIHHEVKLNNQIKHN